MAKTLKTLSRDNYSRVTEILSPYTGYSSAPPDILQAAQDRGQKLHEYAHSFVYEIGLWEVEKAIEGYLESLKLFWGEGFPVVLAEQRFYCDDLQITGACDLLVEKDGVLTLIDWKTSYAPNKTWPIQASAYAYLLRKNSYDVKQIHFVKLDKTGQHPKVFSYKEDFDLFMKCYELYHLFFKSKQKNTIVED